MRFEPEHEPEAVAKKIFTHRNAGVMPSSKDSQQGWTRGRWRFRHGMASVQWWGPMVSRRQNVGRGCAAVARRQVELGFETEDIISHYKDATARKWGARREMQPQKSGAHRHGHRARHSSDPKS